MKDAVLTIATTGGPQFVPGVTPLAENRPYCKMREDMETKADSEFGLNNPTDASSNETGHSGRLANDGDPFTYWAAALCDKDPWLVVDPERVIRYRKLIVTFPQAGNYRFIVEVRDESGNWREAINESKTAETGQQRIVETKDIVGSKLRIRLTAPSGAPNGIAEVRIVGAM
jgi:beta-galactosidase